jgi:hypothetical protein
MTAAAKATHQPTAMQAHAGAWSAARASARLKQQLAAYDDVVDVHTSVSCLAEPDKDTEPGEERYKIKHVRIKSARLSIAWH